MQVAQRSGVDYLPQSNGNLGHGWNVPCIQMTERKHMAGGLHLPFSIDALQSGLNVNIPGEWGGSQNAWRGGYLSPPCHLVGGHPAPRVKCTTRKTGPLPRCMGSTDGGRTPEGPPSYARGQEDFEGPFKRRMPGDNCPKIPHFSLKIILQEIALQIISPRNIYLVSRSPPSGGGYDFGGRYYPPPLVV